MHNPERFEKESEPLPSLPVRWCIFFRLYPSTLLQPAFLFDVLVRRRRYPILWDNIMKAEKQRILRKKRDEEFKDST